VQHVCKLDKPTLEKTERLPCVDLFLVKQMGPLTPISTSATNGLTYSTPASAVVDDDKTIVLLRNYFILHAFRDVEVFIST
jgi:hypothetical protein